MYNLFVVRLTRLVWLMAGYGLAIQEWVDPWVAVGVLVILWMVKDAAMVAEENRKSQ